MRVKAIETRYAGCRFRSRLEARWAVALDHLGIVWEYEPQGYQLPSGLRYLPDFWLPDQQVHIEVKGSEEGFLADGPRYAEAVQTAALPGYELVILGPIPDPNYLHSPYALSRDTNDRGIDVLCLHLVDLTSVNKRDGAACVAGERPDSFMTFCTEVQSYNIGELPPLSRRAHSTSWVHGMTWRSCHSLTGEFAEPPIYESAAPRQRTAYTAARSARFEYGQVGA